MIRRALAITKRAYVSIASLTETQTQIHAHTVLPKAIANNTSSAVAQLEVQLRDARTRAIKRSKVILDDAFAEVFPSAQDAANDAAGKEQSAEAEEEDEDESEDVPNDEVVGGAEAAAIRPV